MRPVNGKLQGRRHGAPPDRQGQQQQHPYDCRVRAASLGWQGNQQTVVAGGVVWPLTVKASGNSISKMVVCVLRLLAGKVSVKL